MPKSTRWLFVFVLLVLFLPLRAVAQNVATRESTVTGTVDRIDRFSRTLTVRSAQNQLKMIAVDPAEKQFDELKTGDRITVRYVESTVVEVRPGAALSNPRDTTAQARAANDQVVDQTKMVVTIEAIDSDGLFVTYRTQDGRKVLRGVADRSLLQGLRNGDRVEVTLTRERAVTIQRGR